MKRAIAFWLLRRVRLLCAPPALRAEFAALDFEDTDACIQALEAIDAARARAQARRLRAAAKRLWWKPWKRAPRFT